MRTFITAAILAAALAFNASGASAQKSKDTLRLPLKFPIDFLAPFYSGNLVETGLATMAIFDTVVMFDEDTNKYVPGLAKSWKQVDDKTLEFEIRDDIKWHDGEAFGPDDVVESLNWFVNPNAKLTNAVNWEWIDRAEKTSPHTVRVYTKRPTPHALARLTVNSDIWPAHIVTKMADRKQFGRAPVGTGSYKVTQLDTNTGIVMVKNPDFKLAGGAKPAAKIGRIHMLPMPDAGTQMAQLLADGVDLIREPEVDQLEDLLKDPRFTTFVDQRISYVYMAIDAAGASGNKALTDLRVRKAMFMALDRNDTTKMSVGDAKIPPVSALCWKNIQAGCDYTAELPARNVAEAKKLLAEAGYPNGFDLQISCYTGTRYTRIATVIAEQFRQIGIKPAINCVPAGTYMKMKNENKVQLVLAGFPAGSMADAAGVVNLFGDPDRLDFHADKEIFDWVSQFHGEMNSDKRAALGRNIFNAYTERAYIAPVAPLPAQYVHRKDLQITGGTLQAPGVRTGDFSWK